MRVVATIIVACLCIGTLGAQQKTEKHISFSGKESVEMNIQIADSINLHTWNKNEVFVTASVNINENKDNDAYIISFDESGNTVGIKARFKDNYLKGKNNCCNKTDIFWEVYVPEKAEFSIETINGNITITGQTEKIKVKSISGYIDLTVPGTRKADIDFSTISGTIYSNHNLALNKMNSGIPTKIYEKMNDGGSPVKLETISGDIFFRKSNSN
jgi:hypothetical protein